MEARDLIMEYDIVINGVHRTVVYAPAGNAQRRISATFDGRSVEADALKISSHLYSILLGGRSLDVTVEETAEGFLVQVAGRELKVQITDPRSRRNTHAGSIELEGRQRVTATMPGKIVSVLVAAGQKVESGQGLFVIEAMKMQNEIRSPKSGTVERLLVSDGKTVSAGEVIAIIT